MSLIVTSLSPIQASTHLKGENLITNPGFERGGTATVADWELSGQAEWVTGEVHSGKRAMKIHANGRSSGIHSAWFTAPAHARIEVSAWLKAQDVVHSGAHYKLRITLHAYEADQETKLAHWDLIATQGSFNWRQVHSAIILPFEAKYLRLSFQLTETTGTVWVDDVEVRVVQTLPAVDGIDIAAPTVIPQPWQMRTAKQTVPLGRVGIVGIDADRRLWQAVMPYLADIDVPYTFVPAQGATTLYDTMLLAGDASHTTLAEHFQRLFPQIDWSDLGEQGYFLSIESGRNQNTIYIGANTEQGRFYAFQTLKQLIDPENQVVYVAQIADRPSLSRRGIPMGIQWFRAQEEVLDRLATFKMNFIWNQGSFLNEKFWYKWREPLTAAEQQQIEAYVERANQVFIQPYIALAPRGEDPSHPTHYSSDADIDQVVEKMAMLYSLGVRNFGLSFDDLGNVGQDVLFGEDKAFFDGSIGKAHAYFVHQVYQRLREKHADIGFMFVPMKYNNLTARGDVDTAYLEALARLPEEIEIYSSVERAAGAQIAIDITERPHMVWDNFWASFYQGVSAPRVVVPLDRPNSFGEELITGYTFAPLIPQFEDEYLISWRTAADYAWAPERYNPDVAFEMAVAQHLSHKPAETDQQALETPVIVPDSGTYAAPLTITLTLGETGKHALDWLNPAPSPDSEAAIHYTTDGSIPTRDSPRYTAPFALTDGATVRVRTRAFKNGSGSGIASAFFQVAPTGMAFDPPSTDAMGFSKSMLAQLGEIAQLLLSRPGMQLLGVLVLLQLIILAGFLLSEYRKRAF